MFRLHLLLFYKENCTDLSLLVLEYSTIDIRPNNISQNVLEEYLPLDPLTLGETSILNGVLHGVSLYFSRLDPY